MCPGASHRFRSCSVIGVGVSAAGTDMQRWNSSKPGAEKMNVTPSGSVEMFFNAIHVLAGMRRVRLHANRVPVPRAKREPRRNGSVRFRPRWDVYEWVLTLRVQSPLYPQLN